MQAEAELVLSPRQMVELAQRTAAIVVELLRNDEGQAALLDAIELGKRIGLSEATIRRMTRDGIIPCRKVGRLTKFVLGDVLKALETRS